MAEKDYSKVPSIVTITNKVEDVEVFDGGTIPVKVTIPIEEVHPGEVIISYGETEEGEEDKTKAVVERKFLNSSRYVQIYGTNQCIILEKGDTVKLLVESSAAMAYYDSLETEEMVFEFSEVQEA